MGLAASQARLLMLTARKDDIESQLSKIANEKLSLSRQTAKAAQEYNDALNAVKLTWNADTGKTVDLTYDLLMKPNATNYENQYLLRNAAGVVILDQSYISHLGVAASGAQYAIGALTYSDNTGNCTGAAAFIAKMMGITAKRANQYVKDAADAGGNTINSKITGTTKYNEATLLAQAGLDDDYLNHNNMLYHKSEGNNGWGGGSPDTSLNDQQIYSNFSNLLQGIKNSLATPLETAIEDELGPDVKSTLDDALDFAYLATIDKFLYNKIVTNSIDPIPPPSGSIDIVRDSQNATGSNQLHYDHDTGSAWCGLQKSNETWLCVDNGQVIDTFLDYFDLYCAEHLGFKNPDDTSANNPYSPAGILSHIHPNSTDPRGATGGTGDGGHTSTSPTGGIDTNDNGLNDAYEAAYYINLYWAIYNSGWEENVNVDDPKYLQNQLLYGDISIDELTASTWDKKANNGQGAMIQQWDPLSLSGSNSPINETTDQDAVNKAEAKYDEEKDLIDVKEAQLDVKSNDLDSERQAISTEIDSVNSILKKNIESSFKYFNSSA